LFPLWGGEGQILGVFGARKNMIFTHSKEFSFFGRKWLIWLIPLVDDHQFGYITPKKRLFGKNNQNSWLKLFKGKKKKKRIKFIFLIFFSCYCLN
jgi:hypothetical protein